MSPLLVGWLAATASAAEPGPWRSLPSPVVYADEADVFSTVAFDTGWWPSASDPISVRFHLTPRGGVITELYGTSEVGWPALSHRVVGEEGGWFGVQTDLTVGSEVKLDLWGLYSGTIALVEERVVLDEGMDLAGLLLPGAARAEASVRVDDPNAFPPIEYAVQVIPTIDLVVAVAVAPTLEAVMSGLRVDAEVAGATHDQDQEDAWVAVAAPPDRPGELGVQTTWTGALRSHLSLVIEPEVRVDTLVGDFTLASFPIPVTLVDDVSERTTAPVLSVFPLPVLDLTDALQVGEVEVGALANAPLLLENLGALVAEGTARIEGDPAFSVWPETLAALPEATDGLQITFAPTAPGEASAELVIESNDPFAPEIRVALSGIGVAEPVVEPEPDPDPVPEPEPQLDEGGKACGCDGAGGAGATWGLLGAAALVGRRRRAAQFEAGVAVGASGPDRSKA